VRAYTPKRDKVTISEFLIKRLEQEYFDLPMDEEAEIT
jgi:hypothetical protein